MYRGWSYLKLSLVLSALLSLCLAMPQTAFACSCVQPGTPAQELANSDAVFAGEVLNIQTPLIVRSSADLTRVIFNVAQVWKGSVTRTLAVWTSSSEASCGFSFMVRQQYIVYARNLNSQLTASLCSRTAPLGSASQDLAALGQGTIPSAPPPSSGIPIPVLIGSTVALILLLVAVALFITRRFLRRRD